MAQHVIITHEFPFRVPHLPLSTCLPEQNHRLEISMRTPVLVPQEPYADSIDRIGMYFEHMEQIVHQNQLNALPGIPMTTEIAVHGIWDLLVAQGVPDQLLYRIRLWETEQKYVEITHAERVDEYQGFE